MEIRSITLFTEPEFDLKRTARFFDAARTQFSVPLQTNRVAFPPFPGWWNEHQTPRDQARELLARWQDAGADYLSLGPVQLNHDQRWIERLADLLGTGGALFASAEVADTQGRIDTARCAAVARLIKTASHLEENGFGNLYFTALANCPPGSPFFPVAYHRPGEPPSFALALEAADVALTAIQDAGSLQEAWRNLQQAIEVEAGKLQEEADELARAHDIQFAGVDFSLAPFPEEPRSLAGALEALGLGHVGAPGSVFAAAFITDAIDRADFRRCGFSGLMLPVLEDAVLAQRAAEKRITVNDLLGLAAVCGVGLDTVPLPGDVSEEVLSGVLLDVAALAARLRKPLTARLMPLPGLAAGDEVHFDFPYFADSRVMPLPVAGVDGLLSGDERVEFLSLSPRRTQDGG
ncbi:MAG: DUF711 family protein [Chloroflexota bacterium]